MGLKVMRARIDDTKIQAAVSEVFEDIKNRPRKFVQSIDIQIGLKDIDVARDKRFSGAITLPHACKPNFNVCVFGDIAACEKAKAAGVENYDVEGLKAFQKTKRRLNDSLRNSEDF